VVSGDASQESKVRTRRLPERRNAHETRDDQTVGITAGSEKTSRFSYRDAALLVLRSGINLHEEIRLPVLFIAGISECPAQAEAINRVDGIEDRYGISGLIRLQ
jgi:hypothetical protein